MCQYRIANVQIVDSTLYGTAINAQPAFTTGPLDHRVPRAVMHIRLMEVMYHCHFEDKARIAVVDPFERRSPNRPRAIRTSCNPGSPLVQGTPRGFGGSPGRRWIETIAASLEEYRALGQRKPFSCRIWSDARVLAFSGKPSYGGQNLPHARIWII